MSYIDEVGGNVFTYDARIFDYDWDPIDAVWVDFLTKSGKKADIYSAIHIDKSDKDPVFESSSEAVAKAYDYELMTDYIYWYDEMFSKRQMFKEDFKVMVYAGMWD